MDNRDFTMHPLALMPQTQGIPDPGSFFDFDSEYTEGNGAYHPAPPEPFGQVTSLASTGGGSDGGQARESSAKSRAERKSHTKSRRGCYNCKRRRIKCSETTPACNNCAKHGIRCEYPGSPTIVHQPHDQIPLFSLQDMRCFQHFILHCYPHHPLGNESVWTHEVPCLSRDHSHLMHAILGLAASSLPKTDPTLLPHALTHRLKAINSIKTTLTSLSTPASVTHESANALLATCLALTVQSVHLDDGVVEYMTFSRGLMVVGIQLWKGGFSPIFANMAGKGEQGVLEPFMVGLPLIRGEWTDGAVAALEGLGGVCKGGVEGEYRALLFEWAQRLYVSSWEAYKALERHYMWWVLLPHESFQAIINPRSQTMLLLAAHWIALQMVMVSVTEAHARCRKKEPGENGGMEDGFLRWLRYLNKRVGGQYRGLIWWPVWVQGQVELDPGFFKRV